MWLFPINARPNEFRNSFPKAEAYCKILCCHIHSMVDRFKHTGIIENWKSLCNIKLINDEVLVDISARTECIRHKPL